MTRGMLCVRLGALLILATCADASRVTAKGSELKRDNSESRGLCAEPAVDDVCECGYKSMKKGFQCSRCKDTNKWGYGCKLDCPSKCPGSCDFSGNCIIDKCPTNCKRNSRATKPTAEKECLNNEGHCQACVSGFHGLMCEQECPQNCDASPSEGGCSRGGTCYSCKLGWYGERCDRKCPGACPKCMQYAGLDDSGQSMPAGSCQQACLGDAYGASCDQPCPKACDRSGSDKSISSCSRDAGVCHKCASVLWGEKCMKTCGMCADEKCNRWDGSCSALGCKPGYFGKECDMHCPKHTLEGCDFVTGLPQNCGAHHFPAYDSEGKAICKECLETCLDGECHTTKAPGLVQMVICTKGCVEGFFGKNCDQECPEHCVGGCNRETGQCHACAQGRTGKHCKLSCHHSCHTCKQFGSDGKKAGIKKNHCLSCPVDHPSELSGPAPTTCGCIKGASSASEDEPCECDKPEDKFMEAFFDKEHNKCSSKCLEEYEGKQLRSVYGQSVHKCIFLDLYNSVVVAGYQNKGTIPNKGVGCDPEEYPIDVFGETHCLHEDFVMYIMGKKSKFQ